VILAPKEEFYYSLGETGLRLVKGSFLPQNLATGQKAESFIIPTLLGSIIVFSRLCSDEEFEVLWSLQAVMGVHPSSCPLLGTSHELHRSLLSPTRGVLDGDLLQQLEQLSTAEQGQILERWKSRMLNSPESIVVSPDLQPHAMTVETMLKLLEKVQRMCFN